MEEEVCFLSNETPKHEIDMFKLLTKEEIIKINQKEPKWRRIRIVILIMFVFLWLGLLATAIAIVVITPKCPAKPKMEYFQKQTGYWLDAMAFSDSNNDGFGDLQGVIDKIDYVKSVGAEYILMDPINSGSWSESSDYFGINKDLETIDPKLGDETEFKSFIRAMRKNGIQVITSLNFRSVLKSSPHEKYKTSGSSSYGPEFNLVDFDLTQNITLDYLHNVTEKWLTLGSSGILLKDFTTYAGPDSAARIELLKKFRESIDKINYNNGFIKFLFVETSISDESASAYLGDGLADMVLNENTLDTNADFYDSYKKFSQNGTQRAFFMKASSSDPMKMALSFLLPGSPLIHYSSELNNSPVIQADFKSPIYPFAKKPGPYSGKIENHLPMPWTMDGSHLKLEARSNWQSYIDTFGIKNSVISAESLGRNLENFELIKKLASVRKLSAGMFGNLEEIFTFTNNDSKALAFIRKAGTGHNDLIIAIMKNYPQITIPMGVHCNSGNYTSMVVYPHNPYIAEGVSYNANNVYLSGNNSPASIYVFKCDSPSL